MSIPVLTCTADPPQDAKSGQNSEGASWLRRNGNNRFFTHLSRYPQKGENSSKSLRFLKSLHWKFFSVIMDDEAYVVEDFKQLHGMCFYTAMQRNGVEEHFRTKKRPSFQKIFGLTGTMQLRSSKPKLYHYRNGKQENIP